MSKNKCFFYVDEILALIDEAKNAGGTDLGIVVSSGESENKKPKLKVGYFKNSESRMEQLAEEEYTGSIDGCPYPPRCK